MLDLLGQYTAGRRPRRGKITRKYLCDIRFIGMLPAFFRGSGELARFLVSRIVKLGSAYNLRPEYLIETEVAANLLEQPVTESSVEESLWE